MPSLIANIAGTILGVGSIATAVAVPLALTAGKDKNQSVEEVASTSHQSREVSIQAQETTQHTESQDSEVQQKLEVDDFKKYCYGGFLKQEREGELFVCSKPSVGSAYSLPLFYLRWGQESNFQFGLVEKIQVTPLGNRRGLTINFDLEEKGNKKITISEGDDDGLFALSAGSHKELQGNCKNSHKKDDNSYQLECTKGTRTTYKKVATKIN